MCICLCIKLLFTSLATALLHKPTRGCQRNIPKAVLIHNSFARTAFFIKKNWVMALDLKPFALWVQARLRLDWWLLWAENQWVMVNAAWNKKQTKIGLALMESWMLFLFQVSPFHTCIFFPTIFLSILLWKPQWQLSFRFGWTERLQFGLILLSIMKLARCVMQCRKKENVTNRGWWIKRVGWGREQRLSR